MGHSYFLLFENVWMPSLVPRILHITTQHMNTEYFLSLSIHPPPLNYKLCYSFTQQMLTELTVQWVVWWMADTMMEMAEISSFETGRDG